MREKCAQGKREFSLPSFPLLLSILLLLFVGLTGTKTFAQTTTATGSIAGAVTDPTGAVVPKAKVIITNPATGLEVRVTASSAGVYNSGPLLPGEYLVSVQAEGFKTTKLTTIVQVGTVTTGDVKLQIGTASTVVEVSGGGPIVVNTVQATVQDVLTHSQIEELPVNGRNFLDLATIEPGVQIQDGATFDPTKNGYSSVSFGGRFGRTARIEVDGVDISDETVGTTTQNIPQNAIQEFQVAQSTLDLSTELTSSGTINVTTRSGTNALHGGGFFYGRSDQLSARIAPTTLPFARKQYGADLGGPFIKDKLFFFGSWERTQQDLANPVRWPDPFTSFSGSFNSPFRDTMFLGRLDYKLKPNASLFYRFSYEQNDEARPFLVSNTYQPFLNRDHTPVHVAGFDFTQGRFTHSLRFGYTKFHNEIFDAVAATGSLNLTPGIELSETFTPFDLACFDGGEFFCTGQNILAPQATYQRNFQGKYDGTFTFSSHTLRYGFAMNAIKGGGFAAFFGLAPAVTTVVNTTTEAAAASVACSSGMPNCPVPGQPFVCPNGQTGANCPLNYPVNTVLEGNGQGFFTELPSFDLPAGGQFDTRVEWYVGDSWKVRHNLTLNYGVRYVRDTGRTDSDLAPIPCSAGAPIGVSCAGNLLDVFGPGLGGTINQPNTNFAPQVGIAWDPTGSGKTVIRAGGGLYYENVIFNNVLFDRPARLTEGLFFGTNLVCVGGSGPASFCGQPVGATFPAIAADQAAFQAATRAAGPTANGEFIGNAGTASGFTNGDGLIAPSYRTPRSWQMNFGIQHQFGANNLLSVDYVRNIGLHYLVGIDVNHVGDARFLDTGVATAAIQATNNFFGCGLSASAAATNCAIASPVVSPVTGNAGASIFDYAGLCAASSALATYCEGVVGAPVSIDSGTEFGFCGGFPCGGLAAFPGKNGLFGQTEMLFPIGRSVYNGLLVSWKSNLSHPLPGFNHMSLLVTYALSRFNSLAADQDFLPSATDANHPLSFFGPSALDRTSNLGLGATIDFPAATRVSLISHWATAPPLTLLLPTVGSADIFTNDITGDGTFGGLAEAGDVLPGTNIGSFGRDVKSGDLASVISNWNSTGAGKITPAGQALVSAGLFTATQLGELGGVTPALAMPVPGHVGLAPTFTTDLQISWLLRPSKLWSNVPESLTVEPQVAIFNVFNYQNFTNFGVSGILSPAGAISPSSVNGVTRQNRTDLFTPGSASGVNWYGVPRNAQFGVKITF